MNQDFPQQPDLAAGLVARDARDHESSSPQYIEVMINREEAFEARVRRVAKLAWAVTFATLPILGIALFTIDQGAGTSVEIARMLMMIFGLAGLLTLLIALLATITWLFRIRSASLAAVEQRLATLERILLAQRDLG